MTDTKYPTVGNSVRLRLSVLYLFIKSRMLPLCGVLLLLIGGELGLFAYAMREVLPTGGRGILYLQDLWERYGILWVFGVCLVLTVLLCGSFGLQKGSHTEYTLRRLSVSESTLHLWQAGFALVSFLLLYLCQILLAYGMAHWYANAMSVFRPDAVGEQTAFLFFYENKLLHSLLPLHDTTRWIAVSAATVALALAVSYFPFCRRQRKIPVIPVFVAIMYAVLMFGEFAGRPGNDWIYTAAFILTVCHMTRIITRGGWRNEEEA